MWWLELTTGSWVQEPDLVRRLAEADRVDEPEPLTADQFVDVVEAIRTRLTGEGDVYALYETAAAIYAMAEVEQRAAHPRRDGHAPWSAPPDVPHVRGRVGPSRPSGRPTRPDPSATPLIKGIIGANRTRKRLVCP